MKNYISRLWWTMKYDYKNGVICNRFKAQFKCIGADILLILYSVFSFIGHSLGTILLPLWIIISPFWISFYHAEKVDKIRRDFKTL